jgi:hypothetical protein
LGYEPSTQIVTVNGDIRVTIVLRRLTALDTVRVRAGQRSIYGVVATAHDLRPLPNATVQIFGSSVGETTTDSAGRFSHVIQSRGAYLVRGKASGLGTQTVSVTVHDDGVEVALLLDSVRAPGANALEMAYGDFRDRLLRRGNASAVVPRSELLAYGDGGLLSAVMSTRSFGAKTLRFTDVACVFVDGIARAGLSLNMIDATSVEAVEVYSAAAERSGTLQLRWPKQATCGDTGLPRATDRFAGARPAGGRDTQSDIVRWVVVWLKK